MSSDDTNDANNIVPFGRVQRFPRQRFMDFLGRLRIQTKDFGLIPIKLLGTQLHVLDEMEKAVNRGVTTIYILKARQLGMTTFFIALDLFWAFENPGLLASFVTHTDQAKAFFRNTIKIFFAHLPKTHKVRWDQENRDMIVLKNSSLMQYMVAGTKEKQKGGLGRSAANNYIHATEVAFWGSPDDLNELSATMSAHYPNRLYVEETTANGFNFWQERWDMAQDDPTICCIFVGWWRHDHYRFDDQHPWFQLYMPKGHASPLTRLERHRVLEVKKAYGIDIDMNQIAWYRWELDSEKKGDQAKMDEQFPWLESDAFVATGSQFFVNQTLTEEMKRARPLKLMPFKYQLGDSWADTQVVSIKDPRKAELKVWEEAKANGHYVIGCDPAYGSSETADRAVIHVARAFSDRLVQVAEFVSPTISTYQCAWVLCHIAGYYHNVMVNLEINGPGEAVFNEMNRLRRETAQMYDRNQPGAPERYDLRNVFSMMRHYLYSRSDSMSQGLAYQWRTTGNNKPPMLSSFKDSFELHKHVLNSMALLDEMKTIIIDGGQIEAETGKKDDRVMAAALAHEAWRRWVRERMIALGVRWEEAYREAQGNPVSPAERIGINYLRQSGIGVPGVTDIR